MTQPSNTPSWLLLERYALGELPQQQRAEVDRALAHDPIARDCLASIQLGTRALPPLPSIAPQTAPSNVKPPWWRSRAPWQLGLLTTAAVGVALALFVPRAVIIDGADVQRRIEGAKGGAVVLSLVRERGGDVVFEPDTFAVSDRLKVRVTCAAAEARRVQVVVYQDGEASFPLPPQTIQCGNRVVLEGAFRISVATAAEVCVFVVSIADGAALDLASRPASHPGMDCAALRAVTK